MTHLRTFLTHLQTQPTIAEYLAIIGIVLLASSAAVNVSVRAVEALDISETAA